MFQRFRTCYGTIIGGPLDTLGPRQRAFFINQKLDRGVIAGPTATSQNEAAKTGFKSKVDQMSHAITKKKTACNRDCPDACSIIATIENGRVTHIGGDPDHPVTQGFLCKRTSRFLKRQYDPNRITTPMIREGKQWKEASWDEALDLVAKKMLELRDTLGPASIMHYRCGGSLGIMKATSDYFFQLFGPCTIKSGDICSGAGDEAQLMDFGHVDSNDLFDLLNAKTIFLWGKNPFISQVHMLPLLKKAKAAGTKIIHIDPIRHRAADFSDQYIQVAPGGDAALALGMVSFIASQEGLDSKAKEYCDNHDQFIELATSKTIEEWSNIAGVKVEEVESAAEAFSNGPTTTLVGWGMQRRRNGASVIRTLDALAAVTGNVGVAGGGVSFYFARKSAFDLDFVDDSLAPRTIPEPQLGVGLESAADPPVEMVWVTAANPVAMLPDSNRVQRALKERFTVVVDSFMTDTARCADVFLPTTTLLEDNDLIGAYGHHYITESRPVIEPAGKAKTDYEIVAMLAPRVGVGHPFDQNIEFWKKKLTHSLAEQGITMEKLREDIDQQGALLNPVAKKVVFADRKFKTPSGKVNLITVFMDPATKGNDHFPLRLTAISTENSQSSQWEFGEQESVEQNSSDQEKNLATLTIHPDSACGKSDGDMVTIESKIGSMQVRLKFDDSQRIDIALMPKGGWLSAGRCANALIAAELTDHGEGACYYDTGIRIV